MEVSVTLAWNVNEALNMDLNSDLQLTPHYVEYDLLLLIFAKLYRLPISLNTKWSQVNQENDYNYKAL